jgi:hypothetical protein
MIQLSLNSYCSSAIVCETLALCSTGVLGRIHLEAECILLVLKKPSLAIEGLGGSIGLLL